MTTETVSYRGVLLDIEGTTAPITFVYDVLFPYAASRLEDYCARSPVGCGIREAMTQLKAEYDRELTEGRPLPPFSDGAPYARYLMEQDRKSTGLKMLQGFIWEEGYRNGSLKGIVFPDVVPALQAWKEAGVRMRIFSSGSVLAQKLLFGHTDYGDLTPYFEGFHDTRTGSKREAGSYSTIAGAFALPAPQILFLSDVVEELDAAREAGMRTGLMVRPGNKPVGKHEHNVYFDMEFSKPRGGVEKEHG